MPPQFYILQTLSEILSSPRNTADERSKVETLARGLFGRQVINPLPGPGRGVLVYEGDETRGGSKGRRHRIKFSVNEAKVSRFVRRWVFLEANCPT